MAKHQFQPGNPGKPKGATAHITRDVREMVLIALNHGGGAEWLYLQMLDNPKAFLALVAKVLPMTVALSNEPGTRFEVSFVSPDRASGEA